MGRLPELLTEVVGRWELTVGAPFDGAHVSSSWVAPVTRRDGTRAILKLGFPHAEAEHEIAGLRFWSGAGAVQVFEADESCHAFLLERCVPGTLLKTLPEPEQDEVLAEMLTRLWRTPEAPHPFRPLAQMLHLWGDETRADEARWPDPGLVRAGLQLFEDLTRPAPTDVLLPTDLHAGNILAAQREPWLVIDPKPYLGDRTYDATQHLLHNCTERLKANPATLIERMASLLDLDPDRLRLWLFARAAAESRESWSDFELARVLAP